MTDVMTAIALRRTQSLSALVRQEVERGILAGEVKPGERINEQALATRLGVSRGPVREALRALERTGLLTSVVNQGVFVREIAEEEAVEIYDVRAVVFGFVCFRLAGRMNPERTAALDGFVARMDAAIERSDSPGYYRLNLDFHDRILDFAEHGRARQTYESLIKETHLLRQTSLGAPARMRESNAEHAALVAALTAGDAERARRLAEEHALGGKRRWLETRR